MTFIVKSKTSQFSDELHPEGITQAVCVDVVNKGEQPTQWGPKLQCEFRFETPARDSKGNPIYLRTWGITVSLGAKANLRKMLERWRGRPFTAEELTGFDLDSVIGAPALLNVVHNSGKEGKTFANIDGVFKDTNAQKYKSIGAYERVNSSPVMQHGGDDDDEPVPF